MISGRSTGRACANSAYARDDGEDQVRQLAVDVVVVDDIDQEPRVGDRVHDVRRRRQGRLRGRPLPPQLKRLVLCARSAAPPSAGLAAPVDAPSVREPTTGRDSRPRLAPTFHAMKECASTTVGWIISQDGKTPHVTAFVCSILALVVSTFWERGGATRRAGGSVDGVTRR